MLKSTQNSDANILLDRAERYAKEAVMNKNAIKAKQGFNSAATQLAGYLTLVPANAPLVGRVQTIARLVWENQE